MRTYTSRLAAALALALSSLAVSHPALAQQPTGDIHGKLVEAGTGRAIATGSVAVRRVGDTSFAGGALPKADGSFRVEGLRPGRYTLRVRVLGYAPAARADLAITAAAPSLDVGTITLSAVAVTLDRQTVTAERPDVTLAPDRNSYSTKNMATATGGTAIDVLRNVPSVEVDESNNVSLRGNQNVVVQINGRATPLKGEQLGNFLAQLPAHTVSRVEVATNPSAKDDPEGTAGIINIVLNQDAEVGWSGGFNAGAGSTGMVNASANVGRQAGKLTWFVSGFGFRDDRTNTGVVHRTNLLTTSPAFVESTGEGTMRPQSGGVTLRSEYKLTPKNTVSIDAFAFRGHFLRDNATYYTNLDESRAVIGLFDQFNEQDMHNGAQDVTLAFRRMGRPQVTTVSTELHYSTSRNDNAAELFGLARQGDASTGTLDIPHERDLTAGRFPGWELQSDFTLPFNAATKLETGFKGTLRHTTNDFTAAYLDTASGAFIVEPARASDFDYREQIGAAYGVLSRQFGKVQTQAGLRLEQAATRFSLGQADERFDKHYGSVFPSAIVSYNFTPVRQLKASYSRRISRPDPFQLSPIEQRQDALNVFHGNPNLRAEYTDAYELTLQDVYGWGSIQVNPYLRKTAHAVRFVQTVDTNGVTIGTFDNVASTTAVGSDLNVSVRRGPVSLFGGGSVYHYSSDASNLGAGFSARGVTWSARANATVKLGARTDLQGFATYRAPTVTEGGRRDAMIFSNVALRYKAWGDKGSISLRVSDPFAVMKFGGITTSGAAIQVSESRFMQRAVFVGVTRSFGQQLKLRPRPQDQDPTAGQPTPGAPGGP